MVKEEGAGEAAGAAGAKEHLQLKIKSQDGDSIEFRVKPSTKFEKIFGVYCQKKGYDMSAVRFLFDGAHLHPDKIVADAELEDGDCIDCVIAQLGGSRH